jgi:hypothetical protein
VNTRPGQPLIGSVSLLIGHALADHAAHGFDGALCVGHFKPGALVVPEIELGR